MEAQRSGKICPNHKASKLQKQENWTDNSCDSDIETTFNFSLEHGGHMDFIEEIGSNSQTSGNTLRNYSENYYKYISNNFLSYFSFYMTRYLEIEDCYRFKNKRQSKHC